MIVEPSEEEIRRRCLDDSFDPCAVAYVGEPLGADFESDGMTGEAVEFESYQPDRLELTVTPKEDGLLVLSEMHYPGWVATVNGRPAPIHKVNALLRGIVVSRGENRVILEYQPRAVRLGTVLTALAILGTFLFAGALRASNALSRKELSHES